MGTTQRAMLVELSHTAQRKYEEDNFDDAWIVQMHTLISNMWPTADRATAQILAAIMAATPYAGWMKEFLIPAQSGNLQHADILLHDFDAIASAGAEGIAREDGLTRRA